jgi:hypothetical protein
LAAWGAAGHQPGRSRISRLRQPRGQQAPLRPARSPFPFANSTASWGRRRIRSTATTANAWVQCAANGSTSLKYNETNRKYFHEPHAQDFPEAIYAKA